MSQDWGRSPTGEVVPGPVCSTCNCCRLDQHCRVGPSAGEWCTFPTVLALSAAVSQAEGPRVAFWSVPAKQNQHAEDVAWYVPFLSYAHILMLRLLLLLMPLPVEVDQNKDRMLEILEGKGLSFLFPLMRLEKELLKQIKVDPSPQSIYKWIKENVSPKLHTDKGFVNILMTRYSTKTFLCTVSSVVFYNYLLLSVSCSIFHMRSALTMRMSSLRLPVKSSWMKRNNFCCPSSQWCRSSYMITLTYKSVHCMPCRSTAILRVFPKVCTHLFSNSTF